MQDNWKEKLQLFLRHRIPLVASIFFMFIFFVPLNSLELNYFRPAVGMICVYYWTLKRGYMFSYISSFIIGFLIDIYSSTPLGINILIMMLLVFIVDFLARYFKYASFYVSWLMFVFVGLLVTFVKWLLFVVYYKQFVSIAEIMLSFASTVMFYPLIVYFNIWIQNSLLLQERINE